MNELLTPRTPGAALRIAREKRHLSVADVVEATRIKTHIIAALEDDDYSVIAAPLYGKGFIKLYAEYVGIDPAPLIRQYLSNYARTVRPTLKTELPPPAPLSEEGIPRLTPMARFRESSGTMLSRFGHTVLTSLRDMIHGLMAAWIRLKAQKANASRRSTIASGRVYRDLAPLPVGKTAALIFAALVVAILVASSFYLFSGSRAPALPAVAAPDPGPAKRLVHSKPLRLAEPPPAPYAKLK